MGAESLRRSVRLKTGWPRFQRLLCPASEKLCFIGGSSGNYKTQAMFNLALDVVAAKQRVLFVSLEESVGTMGMKALARFSQIPVRTLALAQADEVRLTDSEERNFEYASRRLAESEMYLRMHGADTHGASIKAVLDSCTRHRFDAIFIDHIGMVGRDEGSELDVLNRAIDSLRKLTRGQVLKDYRPFVCCTTPLNADAEKDPDREPRISDLRGSARLKYDADIVVVMRKHRDAPNESEGADLLKGYVLKNRDGMCPLFLEFEANGATCTVEERKHSDKPMAEQRSYEREDD